MLNNQGPTRVKIPKKAFLPVYHHLLESTADINFIWGGRDSGKSHFIAQRLILKCLTAKYFRCILIKKQFNTIQESQWQTIKDITQQWGISHLFTFKKSPLSIECINGNKFIARGLDDPQSIKSVKDPSDAWHEEGNQESLDDFITVTTTLRCNQAKVQQWFSFNPECDGDYEDFWLYKNFFKNKDRNGTHEWIVETDHGQVVYNYTSTWTTYKDNPRCSPQRIAFLEKLKDIDPYYYQVYTKGLWGRRKNNSPFFFAYDRAKHVRKTKHSNQYETIAVFDFNRNPMASQVWQIQGNTVAAIEAIKMESSNIYEVCDYLVTKYPNVLWLVTGDATGKNSSALVQDNINYYTVIKSKLNLSISQLKVPAVNPPVSENRVLCNAVLATMDVAIDPDNCKPLIFDLENVRVMPDGSLEKKDRKDATQQADHADCFRYLCNTFFKSILRE